MGDVTYLQREYGLLHQVCSFIFCIGLLNSFIYSLLVVCCSRIANRI